MMDAPQRIIVRLGDDLNWWVDTADGPVSSPHPRGVLDPRQLTYLIQTLNDYRPDGYRPQQLAEAFQAYRIDAEISEGVLRLAAVDELDDETFALPVMRDDEDGAYFDFLEAVIAAHIRRLNRTHHFVRDCTEVEMNEDLAALDTDRYFSEEIIHAFDEISEILEWDPAEWDASSSS